MKYKVGDRVQIKSLDWYNENKDEEGNIPLIGNTYSSYDFIKTMRGLCGKVMTISSVYIYSYNMVEDNGEYFWTDEMIEGLVEDENNHLTEVVVDTVRESNDRHRIVIDPRFDIEVDEGEYYVVRRKKEYPKTYEECRRIMDIDTGFLLASYDIDFWKGHLLTSLQKLLICRDAYWKIAGEEIGLGKLWEPDWTNQESPKYCLASVEGQVKAAERYIINTNLAFPTPEMRDAFKENFKGLINECKELL